MNPEQSYPVPKLDSGTVIDHLRGRTALRCLQVLRLPEDAQITVGINLRSERLGRKDIIKVGGHELGGEEAAKLALISPDATLSIIRDYEVHSKLDLVPPLRFRGLMRCTNPVCITNTEHVLGGFLVLSNDPVVVRCEYCERSIEAAEFAWE
ncbi:MAG: aspartate carbamoyltransferase regulatory subunit [Planctomycetota bacterium]